MTKLKSLLVILIIAVVLTSCGVIRESIDAGKKVETSALHIGMSKAEVQKALNKKPENIVAARNYPESSTSVEVVEYTQWANGNTASDPGAKKVASYWFYFVNDKLDHWEKAGYGRPQI